MADLTSSVVDELRSLVGAKRPIVRLFLQHRGTGPKSADAREHVSASRFSPMAERSRKT
jgi:hypothetical protein